MHADRTNRTLLIVLALLLLAIGLDAGAASIGVYGTATQNNTLMDNPTGHYFGAHGVWLWPVVAVAALIIGGARAALARRAAFLHRPLG